MSDASAPPIVPVDGEWWAIIGGATLAGVGWGLHISLMTLGGCLALVTAFVLWVWHHKSLVGVGYRRTLEQHQAIFGEEVRLDIELVNDKLLPLTWLYVADTVPAGLPIVGAAGPTGQSARRPQLRHLLPMLPYQRIRRRFTVLCERRGDHVFGPAQLTSSNPAGYREKTGTVEDLDRLLVYPKLFRVADPVVDSLVPLGDRRSRRHQIGDPSRPVGVREYRAGDPVRHIDWRASARSDELLVRVFEPSTAPRVALFCDARVSPFSPSGRSADIAEFTIAVTASLVSEWVRAGVPVGLYATATVDHDPITRAFASSPNDLPALLTLLARCVPTSDSTAAATLLARETNAMAYGTSVVLVAADFAPSTMQAVADLRRRLPVTLGWIDNDLGRRPPTELTSRWEVSYDERWTERDVLQLAL